MKIALDMDATITEAPAFFSLLSRSFQASGHEVHIITFRDDRESTIQELKDLGIHYDSLHLPGDSDVRAPKWKAKLALRLEIDVFFEDSPEVIERLPSSVKVFWLIDRDLFDLSKMLGVFK